MASKAGAKIRQKMVGGGMGPPRSYRRQKGLLVTQGRGENHSCSSQSSTAPIGGVRENKDQLENFNIFETSKGDEWFYNKIGLAQREILSVILGLLREFEPWPNFASPSFST